MNLYWGDIHAHCAVSYGNGTLERALNNARAHLDFCSITGHAFWPDMPMDLVTQNTVIGMHYGGFAKLRYYWKDVLAGLQAANQAGFVEWAPAEGAADFVVAGNEAGHYEIWDGAGDVVPRIQPPLALAQEA